MIHRYNVALVLRPSEDGREREGEGEGREEKRGEGREREFPPKGNPVYGPDRALTFDYKSNYIFHPPSS